MSNLVIAAEGRYRTRNGLVVEVQAINQQIKFGVIGQLLKPSKIGERRFNAAWAHDGRFLNHSECIYDIVGPELP